MHTAMRTTASCWSCLSAGLIDSTDRHYLRFLWSALRRRFWRPMTTKFTEVVDDKFGRAWAYHITSFLSFFHFQHGIVETFSVFRTLCLSARRQHAGNPKLMSGMRVESVPNGRLHRKSYVWFSFGSSQNSARMTLRKPHLRIEHVHVEFGEPHNVEISSSAHFWSALNWVSFKQLVPFPTCVRVGAF